MEDIKHKYRSPKRHGITIGVILITLGTLFLFFNFGLIDGNFKKVVFSWQMLLIAFAVVAFFQRHFFSGILLLLTGIFFIIPRIVKLYPDLFGWFGNDFASIYWPALLIALGVLIILKLFLPWSKSNRYRIYIDNYSHKRHRCNGRRSVEQGYVERNTVFGSIEEIVLDPVFAGGDFNCAFGNIILDLRKTTLAEGDTELEINSAFGGIELLVPDNWNVALHISTFISGFADERKPSAEIDYTRKLIITGSFAFSGGEIKS